MHIVAETIQGYRVACDCGYRLPFADLTDVSQSGANSYAIEPARLSCPHCGHEEKSDILIALFFGTSSHDRSRINQKIAPTNRIL